MTKPAIWGTLGEILVKPARDVNPSLQKTSIRNYKNLYLKP